MDHQTLAALLGNYGEFFSSLGVLATLLILVIQIRGARTEFSNQMRRDIKRHNNDDIKFLIKDPRSMNVHIQAQRDFESLSEDDRVLWAVWLFSWITQTEDTWLARNHGIENMEFAEKYMEGVAQVLRSDGGQRMWPRIRGWYDEEFAKKIDEQIKQSEVTWLDQILGYTAPSSIGGTNSAR